MHTKYLLMTGKHQESSYCYEVRPYRMQYYFSKWHQIYFCHQFLCAHNPSAINGLVQISTINKTLVHGNFWSLRVGWTQGGDLVTTISDNQFRTLVLLERSLFGLLVSWPEVAKEGFVTTWAWIPKTFFSRTRGPLGITSTRLSACRCVHEFLRGKIRFITKPQKN